MLRNMPLSQRVRILLLALIILGGMSWADTLDLSDDIPLSQPLTVVQQAIAPNEESREDLLGLVHGHQAVWLVASFVPQPHASCFRCSLRIATVRPTPLSTIFDVSHLIFTMREGLV